MEGQERHDRPVEVLDVLGLGLLPASGVGFLLLGEALGGSLGFEFGTNTLDRSPPLPRRPVEKTFRPFFSATTQ